MNYVQIEKRETPGACRSHSDITIDQLWTNPNWRTDKSADGREVTFTCLQCGTVVVFRKDGERTLLNG